MQNFITKTILPLMAFLLMSIGAHAVNPASPEGRLFHLERSKNSNLVCYDVNKKGDQLDTKNPINAYWIRNTQGGIKKELTYLQRKMAFGYKVIKQGNNEVTVQLSAYNKVDIRVCRHDNNWVALCTMNGREFQINKMYVQLRNPDSIQVDYIDIYGTTLTGKSVKERIYNK